MTGKRLLPEPKEQKAAKRKGQMARQLVYFCVGMLTAAAVWAMIVKTIDHQADLNDILTFIGAAFGGELLMLLLKRVFAKDKSTNEMEDEPWNS